MKDKKRAPKSSNPKRALKTGLPRNFPLKVPPILLEGDDPIVIPEVVPPKPEPIPVAPVAVEPTPEPAAPPIPLPVSIPEPPAEAPSHFSLVTREPGVLFATWHLPQRQMQVFQELSVTGQLAIRQIRLGNPEAVTRELQVSPGVVSCFLSTPTDQAEWYACELGIYNRNTGSWMSVLRSNYAQAQAIPHIKPPEPAASPRFVTRAEAAQSNPVPPPVIAVPVHPTFTAQPQDSVAPAPAPNGTIHDESLRQLETLKIIPTSAEFLDQPQSPLYAKPLLGSVPPQIKPAPRVALLPSSAEFLSPGSKKDFWLKVRAEVIVYGATDSLASLYVQGVPVALQPDGTFTLHYTLPDGSYPLKIIAVSADATDNRKAMLEFTRVSNQDANVGNLPEPSYPKPIR